MKGFYGMQLLSRQYGEGTLKDWNGKTVTVKFAEKTVRCWFPKAFECGELTATNEQDALRVREAIDGWVTSLFERVKGPLSARVLSQQSLTCMVERIGKILHGCYPAEEIEQRLLAYRETLLLAQKEPAETPSTPFRAFLRKHAKLFAILPIIGLGVMGAICILAPLGSLAQLLGVGSASGYDYLEILTVITIKAFTAGVHIPIILSIVFAGLFFFGAVNVFIMPWFFGEIGYDIFGLTFSFAAFATGVGQAAWIGSRGLEPGVFPILLIVFGIVFAACYATLTAFRKKFRKELAVTWEKPDDIEYDISMLLFGMAAKPAQK